MEVHQKTCVGFVCTCRVVVDIDDSADAEFHPDSCECRECRALREADKDREFDEKVALGYFV